MVEEGGVRKVSSDWCSWGMCCFRPAFQNLVRGPPQFCEKWFVYFHVPIVSFVWPLISAKFLQRQPYWPLELSCALLNLKLHLFQTKAPFPLCFLNIMYIYFLLVVLCRGKLELQWLLWEMFDFSKMIFQ